MFIFRGKLQLKTVYVKRWCRWNCQSINRRFI